MSELSYSELPLLWGQWKDIYYSRQRVLASKSMTNIELKLDVWTMVSKLQPRYEYVLRMRYLYGYTLKEIGSFMGLSRERIRQMESKAFSIFRKRFEGYSKYLPKHIPGYKEPEDYLKTRACKDCLWLFTEDPEDKDLYMKCLRFWIREPARSREADYDDGGYCGDYGHYWVKRIQDDK